MPGHNSARVQDACPNCALSDSRLGGSAADAAVDGRFRSVNDGHISRERCNFYAATKGRLGESCMRATTPAIDMPDPRRAFIAFIADFYFK